MHTGLYAPEDAERGLACLFGLPAVIEWPRSTIFTSTIGHAWRACAGNTFVIQAGQAGLLQTAVCERLFHSLIAFLFIARVQTREVVASATETYLVGQGQ